MHTKYQTQHNHHQRTTKSRDVKREKNEEKKEGQHGTFIVTKNIFNFSISDLVSYSFQQSTQQGLEFHNKFKPFQTSWFLFLSFCILMILTWPQSNVIRRNLLVFCIYTFMFMSERVMHKRNLHI